MVDLVRSGMGTRKVAQKFGIDRNVVRFWVKRAGTLPLEQVEWGDRVPGAKRAVNRTSEVTENLILKIRKWLKKESPLGEWGAQAIFTELQKKAIKPCPKIRTINRILDRRGALDGRKRIRRPPPPPGWYLPGLADFQSELDSFDMVEGLALKGGLQIEVINAISLHGGLPGSKPDGKSVQAVDVIEFMKTHWTENGRPNFAQFDNDMVFLGPQLGVFVLSKVVRFCLQVGVIPVFVPPRETGFQASVESFNNLWQQKVWHRFEHKSIQELIERSKDYITAYREKLSRRIDSAPSRRPGFKKWPEISWPIRSKEIIFIRRLSPEGKVSIYGKKIHVDSIWAHRLVRSHLDLEKGTISFWTLRRKDPKDQRFIKELSFDIPALPILGC